MPASNHRDSKYATYCQRYGWNKNCTWQKANGTRRSEFESLSARNLLKSLGLSSNSGLWVIHESSILAPCCEKVKTLMPFLSWSHHYPVFPMSEFMCYCTCLSKIIDWLTSGSGIDPIRVTSKQGTHHNVFFAAESKDFGNFSGPESGLDLVHLHGVPAHRMREPEVS